MHESENKKKIFDTHESYIKFESNISPDILPGVGSRTPEKVTKYISNDVSLDVLFVEFLNFVRGLGYSIEPSQQLELVDEDKEIIIKREECQEDDFEDTAPSENP